MAYHFQFLGAQVRGEPAKARKIIEGVLAKNDGNATATAKELGVSRPALYRWMEFLAIPTPQRTRSRALAAAEDPKATDDE